MTKISFAVGIINGVLGTLIVETAVLLILMVILRDRKDNDDE